MRLHVVADRLDDAALEAVLVRAAGDGADAVDVGAEASRRSIRSTAGRPPSSRRLPSSQVERRLGDGRLLPVGDELAEELGNAAGVRQVERFAGDLVLEGDLQAAVDVRHVLQVGLDQVGVEVRGLEDLRVGLEVDGRAVPAKGAELSRARWRPCRA